jgi:hypothetical protein
MCNSNGRKGPCLPILLSHLFWDHTPYKKIDEVQQMFIEDIMFYICKGYWAFSTIRNFWLRRSILCWCPQVSFSSWTILVNEMLLAMVKKTLDFHVLSNFASIATISYNCDLWMFRASVNIFALVIKNLNESWTPMHVTMNLFEMHETKVQSMVIQLESLLASCDCICERWRQ